MLKEIANESLRLRASYHAAHSTPEHDARFDPTPFEFVDPVDQEGIAKAKAEEVAAAEQFNAELGYS